MCRAWSNRCSWGDAVAIDPLVGAWRRWSAYAEIAVDTTWQADWVGAEQFRYFRIDGDTLTLRSDQTRLPPFGDRLPTMVVVRRRGEAAIA
jgi:hypothetical protein